MAAERRIVRVGAFENFPLLFQGPKGEVQGLYPDILSAIGQKESLEFIYIFGTWQEGLDRIKAGEVDMLTSVAHTPERATYMDFCEIPLLTVWGELYTVIKSDINGILDIDGKKIGILKSDINARNFTALCANFGVQGTFVEYSSYDEVFASVAMGKVDAGVAGVTFGSSRQKNYGLRSTGVVFNPLDIYFTTSLNRTDGLRETLDRYLEEWKRQQTSVYGLAKQKWLYGAVGAIPVLPKEFYKYLILAGFLLALAFVFIVLLRIQVRRAIRKHQTSEEKFFHYIDNAPDGVFVTNRDGRYLIVNRAAETITGYSQSELLNMTIPDLLPPADVAAGLAHFTSLKESGKASAELTFRHKSGEIRWWSVDAIKIAPDRFLGFTKDITARKTDENRIQTLLSEKDLLLREVHHRIKNNMNTIKGLLSMQIAAEKNEQTIASLKDAESRVQSIILLYDRLYCTDNYRELSVRHYLEPLTSEIIHSFPGSDTISLVTEIGDFVLNVQYLSPLGIIVNELLTNMMKHAFVGRDRGSIRLSAALDENTVRVIVRDDGIGLPESVDFDGNAGFGMRLVQLLIEQIDGTINVERNNGTTFTIEFRI